MDEIDAKDKPTIMVFNKIDAYQPEPLDENNDDEPTKAHYTIEDWKRTWMSKLGDKALFISALNKENLEDFRKRVYKEVRKIHITRFPYNNFLYPDVEDIT